MPKPRSERIKQLRSIARLNQFEVSKLSGVERSRLSLAENGHVELRPEEYAAIEKVLCQAAQKQQAQDSRLLVASA